MELQLIVEAEPHVLYMLFGYNDKYKSKNTSESKSNRRPSLNTETPDSVQIDEDHQ